MGVTDHVLFPLEFQNIQLWGRSVQYLVQFLVASKYSVKGYWTEFVILLPLATSVNLRIMVKES